MSAIYLSEKIEKLKNIVSLLEEINELCYDIKIVNHEGNVDYYCSLHINTIASDVEFLVPPYGVGSYNCCLYKNYQLTNNKIRIYGNPLMIKLFDVDLNYLSISPYEETLNELNSLPIIKSKVERYIINFISTNNLKINPDIFPKRIKSLLAFT